MADDPKIALRKKLLRRLIWKAPLIFLLVLFAVWWQARSENGTESVTSSPKAAQFTGAWEGEVSYPWAGAYNERFFFQPEGGKLFGTASVLRIKHGIEEGKIEGESISFFVRFEKVSGNELQRHKNYYWGKLAGSDISMRMQDDRGNPPVDFVLRKAALGL